MTKTKILIVEDSLTQSQRLSHLLLENHYEVMVAKNGQDALNQIEQINPMLLISDVMMPEMDGYQLCRALRAKPQFAALPIILLTTLADTEDIAHGLECGANYFITKPYEDHFLIKHVENVLSIHHLRLNESPDGNVKILLNGNEHIITANKTQILDLLVSIYEAALLKNQQLCAAQLELHELNAALEQRVEERTQALKNEMLENAKLYEEQIAHTNQIESYLKEREAILKEIYHRVKNNLQVISSLLSLQLRTVADVEAKSVLIKSAARIKSMALVHELLYQSRDLAKISMKAYAQYLARYLYELYGVDSNKIRFIIEGDEVEFKIEKAISCGLIINEVISNSLKYAFQGRTQGEIRLTLMKDADHIVLSISDNGQGVPEQVTQQNTHSLGMNLIFSLAKQIDGEVELDRKEGTCFRFTFPREAIIA